MKRKELLRKLSSTPKPEELQSLVSEITFWLSQDRDKILELKLKLWHAEMLWGSYDDILKSCDD
jgi:hypothetical protein